MTDEVHEYNSAEDNVNIMSSQMLEPEYDHKRHYNLNISAIIRDPERALNSPKTLHSPNVDKKLVTSRPIPDRFKINKLASQHMVQTTRNRRFGNDLSPNRLVASVDDPAIIKGEAYPGRLNPLQKSADLTTRRRDNSTFETFAQSVQFGNNKIEN